MSDLFADLPWFLKEYVHSNRWSSFRSIQTETYELIRNSDCHVLIAAGTSSGKTEAALALAQCIVCPNGGCGSCDECIRVRHRTHPDVRVVDPESASGYLVEQVRELIDDVPLAPVRGQS